MSALSEPETSMFKIHVSYWQCVTKGQCVCLCCSQCSPQSLWCCDGLIHHPACFPGNWCSAQQQVSLKGSHEMWVTLRWVKVSAEGAEAAWVSCTYDYHLIAAANRWCTNSNTCFRAFSLTTCWIGLKGIFFFLTITVISSVVVRSEKKWNLRCAARLTSDQNDPFQNTYSISLGKETFRVSKKGSNAAQLSSRHPIMEPNKGNNIMCNERRLRGFRIGFPFDRLKKKTMPFKHVAGRRLWKQIVVTHTDQINDITVQSSATVTVKWGHSR